MEHILPFFKILPYKMNSRNLQAHGTPYFMSSTAMGPDHVDSSEGESSSEYPEPPSPPRHEANMDTDTPHPAFSQGHLSEPELPQADQPMLPPGPAVNDNGETPVCGVYSPEIQTPQPKASSLTSNYRYICPRCKSGFSRRYSVRTHFPICIRRYGNPDSLKWTDHESANPYKKRRENRYNRLRRLHPRTNTPETGQEQQDK